MSLQDLVNVTITSTTVTPTRPGFGTPLLMVQHSLYSDLVRFYSNLAAVVADGFTTSSLGYRMAVIAFAQNPAPAKIAIGQRKLKNTQTVKLTLGSTSNLDTYSFTIVGSDNVPHAISFASTGVPATDAATLVTTINALTNVGTAAAVGAVVTVTQAAAAGKLNDYQNWNVMGSTTPIITLQDVTADPGIATDLANALAFAPPGSVYGVALDSNSFAEITACAAAVEAQTLLFIWNNSDTLCISSPTSINNIFKTEAGLAHARSGGLYSNTQLLSWSGVGWLSKTLPNTPGSLTFMYKTLSSVPADNISETAQLNLNTNHGNYYITIAGIPITVNGWDAAGEFFDQVWGTDALTAQIQIDVFALLAGSPKVPYTDAGVDMIKSVISSDLALFSSPQYNFIATNPAPTVSAPAVSTIAAATRASRNFPSISFSGKLAGAIHQLTIAGVLTA